MTGVQTCALPISKAQADHDASVKALNDNYTQLKSQLDAQQAKLVNDDQAQYNALATKLGSELTALKDQVLPKPADHQTAQNKQVVAGNTDTVALDNSGKTTIVLPRVTSDINGEKPESVKFLPQTGN